MKIEFTHDFRGKLTGEQFYVAGTQIEIDDEIGQQLIALGHAVEVEEAAPEPKPEPKRRASKPAAKSKATDDGD